MTPWWLVRVLLDEQLPRQLARHLADEHDVKTVQQQGWAGLSDPELLRRAEQSFDVFVTADQNLQFQQNLARSSLGVLVLVARSNTLNDLTPLVGKMLQAILGLQPGQVVRVQA